MPTGSLEIISAAIKRMAVKVSRVRDAGPRSGDPLWLGEAAFSARSASPRREAAADCREPEKTIVVAEVRKQKNRSVCLGRLHESKSNFSHCIGCDIELCDGYATYGAKWDQCGLRIGRRRTDTS